jgi:Uma2 family endonuclease
MSVQSVRWTFDVNDYHRMAEAGILSEDARVELIEGEIIKMSPIGSRHAGCVNRLTTILTERTGRTAIVSVQNPVRLDDYSEPEPDIILLKPRGDFYAGAHPTPQDVLLIIEVAETSLDYDIRVKMPLYARAGIPEVWVANLVGDTFETYSDPVGGVYRKTGRVLRGEKLSPLQMPSLILDVDEILG